MSIYKIWQIADENEFIVALADYVAQKCESGDNMAALSAPERIFFITQTCEAEVNNGGFAQFLTNSSGDLAGELANAFQTIGARQTAEICRRALGLFGRELPAAREERCELLDVSTDAATQRL